ncbi:MAG: polysaccharide deacetylase family protein, partial [Bacteroidales bacterium]|nr:polysaccharide deacetylase family protein [Bacteroidales bacterium]
MSANKCFITTSWDDGYPLDFRLCSLLKKYGLPATFYIPKTNSQYTVMSESQIRDISTEYEIGGHTLSHRKLTSLTLNESAAEIQGCKRWIEDTIGQSPKCFSPPGGFYNRKIAGQIFSAGFETMRTTTLLSLDKYRKNNN